jgi:hypothetical protein
MSHYNVTNRQRRAWIIPATANMSHAAVPVDAGQTVQVATEHWDTVRKGNLVIDALLTERHLVVTQASAAPLAVEAEELSNPTSPAAPEALDTPLDGIALESKGVEIVETPEADALEVKPTRSRKA